MVVNWSLILVCLTSNMSFNIVKPRHEKSCIRGLRQGKTNRPAQT